MGQVDIGWVRYQISWYKLFGKVGIGLAGFECAWIGWESGKLQLLKIWETKNLPLGKMMFHQSVGPDLVGRFNNYSELISNMNEKYFIFKLFLNLKNCLEIPAEQNNGLLMITRMPRSPQTNLPVIFSDTRWGKGRTANCWIC